jgi:sec-independent protein translocase protein TatA
MAGLGWPELLVIGLVVLVFFGAKRLPEIGRSFGKGLREFKNSVTGLSDDTAALSAPKDGRRFCASCGGALEAGDKFCAQCGGKAQAEAGAGAAKS